MAVKSAPTSNFSQSNNDMDSDTEVDEVMRQYTYIPEDEAALAGFEVSSRATNFSRPTTSSLATSDKGTAAITNEVQERPAVITNEVQERPAVITNEVQAATISQGVFDSANPSGITSPSQLSDSKTYIPSPARLHEA